MDIFNVVFIQTVVVVKVGGQTIVSFFYGSFFEHFTHYLLKDICKVPSILFFYSNKGNLWTVLTI